MKKILTISVALALLTGCDLEKPKEINSPYASLKVLNVPSCQCSVTDGEKQNMAPVDFNTSVFELIAYSKEVHKNVYKKLHEYEKKLWEGKDPVIKVEKDTYAVKIYCPTSSPSISAKIANIYAEELIDYAQYVKSVYMLKEIEELMERVKKQTEKVALFETSLAQMDKSTSQYKLIEREKKATENLYLELADKMNRMLSEVNSVQPPYRQIGYARP